MNCDNANSPAFAALQKGYKIYAVGLGGVDIRLEDEDKLEHWVECTGGMYKKAEDADALASVYTEIYEDVKGKSEIQTICGGQTVTSKPTPSPSPSPVPNPTKNPALNPTKNPLPIQLLHLLQLCVFHVEETVLEMRMAAALDCSVTPTGGDKKM